MLYLEVRFESHLVQITHSKFQNLYLRYSEYSAICMSKATCPRIDSCKCLTYNYRSITTKLFASLFLCLGAMPPSSIFSTYAIQQARFCMILGENLGGVRWVVFISPSASSMTFLVISFESFRTVIDLQNYCEDSIENPHIPHVHYPLLIEVLILY